MSSAQDHGVSIGVAVRWRRACILLAALWTAGSIATATAAEGEPAATLLPASSAEAGGAVALPPLAPTGRVNAWGNARFEHQAAPRAEASSRDAGEAPRGERFRVIDLAQGAAHLAYTFPHEPGRLYRASLRVRAAEPMQLEVMMRRDVHPYDPFALRTIAVGPSWQQVELEGRPIAAGAVSLRVVPGRPGVDVWVDDVRIEPGPAQDYRPVQEAPIGADLFGLHLMRLGMHAHWPSLNPGFVRLWDTRTTWKDLQPEPGAWDFSTPGFRRLDLYVEHIRRHGGSTKILYVLGQTPRWASSEPDSPNAYGPGHGAPPKDMEHWRQYVRTLARRYAGRITHWELWNEPDYRRFYRGSMDAMMEMTRIAHEELKAADPGNVIVSPGLTAGQGLRWLDRFLQAGGGRYVDVIGFHWYYSMAPETMAPFIDNVRGVMRAHGVDHKPLWNTEGALVFPTRDAEGTPVSLAEDLQRGLTPRALLVMWSRGVSGFAYYFWEGRLPGERMRTKDFGEYTEPGLSYLRAAAWIQGARLVDGYRTAQGVHVVKLQRGERISYIVWATDEPRRARLPEDWAVSRAAHLDGTVAEVPPDRTVPVGAAPLLLE